MKSATAYNYCYRLHHNYIFHLALWLICGFAFSDLPVRQFFMQGVGRDPRQCLAETPTLTSYLLEFFAIHIKWKIYNRIEQRHLVSSARLWVHSCAIGFSIHCQI